MSGFRRLIVASRYSVLLAIMCITVAMVITFLSGAVLTVELASRIIRQSMSATITKALLLDVIELVDLFLVGTTLYVIAIGLYELFIDPNLPSPPWLIIRSLDDLKHKVLVLVIVVLGVFFLGQVLAWDGDRDLLPLGAAIALVIGALTLFLGVPGKKPVQDRAEQREGAARDSQGDL